VPGGQRRQHGLRAGGQAEHASTLVDAHAVAAGAGLQHEAPVGVEVEPGMVRRHVRIVQHDLVVERTAQVHRPGGHVPGLLHPAVGVEQLDLRHAERGSGGRQRVGGHEGRFHCHRPLAPGAAAGVQPKPCR
jgi:hypothetical protein